jgi:hypothetical protein
MADSVARVSAACRGTSSTSGSGDVSRQVPLPTLAGPLIGRGGLSRAEGTLAVPLQKRCWGTLARGGESIVTDQPNQTAHDTPTPNRVAAESLGLNPVDTILCAVTVPANELCQRMLRS